MPTSRCFRRSSTTRRSVEMCKYMLFARALDAKVAEPAEAGQGGDVRAAGGRGGDPDRHRVRDEDRTSSSRTSGSTASSWSAGSRSRTSSYTGGGSRTAAEVPKTFQRDVRMRARGHQMPHAARDRIRMKYKGKDAAVVAYVGDGGTSEGDFYEALNFAGVWKVPLVAIIENNQWAISVPRSSADRCGDASAEGHRSRDKVRSGRRQRRGRGIQGDKGGDRRIRRTGPTLIECVTYRMSMHTTADDPTRYRSDAEVAEWAKKDPIDQGEGVSC